MSFPGCAASDKEAWEWGHRCYHANVAHTDGSHTLILVALGSLQSSNLIQYPTYNQKNQQTCDQNKQSNLMSVPYLLSLVPGVPGTRLPTYNQKKQQQNKYNKHKHKHKHKQQTKQIYSCIRHSTSWPSTAPLSSATLDATCSHKEGNWWHHGRRCEQTTYSSSGHSPGLCDAHSVAICSPSSLM